MATNCHQAAVAMSVMPSVVVIRIQTRDTGRIFDSDIASWSCVIKGDSESLPPVVPEVDADAHEAA
jgi:hypothetical protein